MSRPADRLSPENQAQALRALEYVRDLFRASPVNSFTRADVLFILRQVMHDEEIFDPEISQAQDEAAEITDYHPTR